MVNLSGWNGYINSHLLYQHDLYFNDGDNSCVNSFIKSHNIWQCNDSIYFKDMGEYVENCDVSGGHGCINSHTLYQQNGLKPLIHSNNSDDIEINYDLHNGDLCCGIGLINSHALYQFNW